MWHRDSQLIAFIVITTVAVPSALAADDAPPNFRIKNPPHVLRGVPVKEVTIEALNNDGKLDTSYNGRPLIEGISITERDPKSGEDVEVSTGAFKNGIWYRKSDPQTGRKVFITADEVTVTPPKDDKAFRRPAAFAVPRMSGWWSIVPPLLAVILAVVLRNVLIALFAAVWSGAVILTGGDVLGAFLRTLDTYIIGEVVSKDGTQYPHMLVILFTVFLGAMIGVMSRSGGTQAIVNSLARVTRKREHGQVLTWGMGFAVFFDDYANTLLVGGTMRPVTDRLKISREKLAFLVDATAAPVAGLALISTWVGVEVSYIQSGYDVVFAGSDLEYNAYSVFIATLPFRFYALHMLVFVLLIAYSGNDFGPMLHVERRALLEGDVGAIEGDDSSDFTSAPPNRILLRNALLPLLVLVGVIAAGLWITGNANLEAGNKELAAAGKEPVEASLWTILGESSSSLVIFYAAFLASSTAVISAVAFRSLNLRDAMEGWVHGAKSMFSAVLILVMAWAVATICKPDNLNTASFLVETTGQHLSASWTPALAFVLAAVIAFATGSSYATMGLLMPLFITLTYYLLAAEQTVDPYEPQLMASIGAVLAGSIFGDHCSPISDTTVLSSAATGCDHLRHVYTQLPYALTVGGVALLLGYIPAGFGISPFWLLPIGLIVVYVIVQFAGQSPGESPEVPAEPLPEIEDAPTEPIAAAKRAVEPEPEPPPEENLDDLDVDWDALPD